MIIKQGEFEMNEISKHSNWKDEISTHYAFSDDIVFFATKRIKIEKEMEKALKKMDDEHFYIFCDGKIMCKVKYKGKILEKTYIRKDNGKYYTVIRIDGKYISNDSYEIATGELSCGSLSSIYGILECGINFEDYVRLFLK